MTENEVFNESRLSNFQPSIPRMKSADNTITTNIQTHTARIFLAVPLPENTSEELYTARQSLRNSLTGVRWIPPENYHITLIFIGTVPFSEIPSIIKALAPVQQNIESIPIEFNGPGIFCSPKKSGIIYEKITDSEKMQHSLRQEMLPLIRYWVKRTEKNFQPHVTLGRIKRTGNINNDNILKTATEYDKVSGFHAGRIVLYKSNLMPTGAVYTPIHEFRRNQ